MKNENNKILVKWFDESFEKIMEFDSIKEANKAAFNSLYFPLEISDYDTMLIKIDDLIYDSNGVLMEGL